MTVVRDDPSVPDEVFAELYAQLPDATDLSPWLELAKAATPPVLYLGIGTGRLAVPLRAAGIELVGVDSHPGMLSRARRRLPETELIHSRIEDLDLRREFSLVMVPSNILDTVERLRRAAAHVSPGGLLAAELTNPHWLQAGAGHNVRVKTLDGNVAQIEVDYTVSSGRQYIQHAEVALVWPDEVERWLGSSGLKLHRMFGPEDDDLTSSPSFYLVARK
ncbi:MAG: class I SAM-dependent methyltransferase [Chloroflexi bacterium]|nr:MAG: class I SAM-dependent methyltransferase [Chloroflexota bacterium]